MRPLITLILCQLVTLIQAQPVEVSAKTIKEIFIGETSKLNWDKPESITDLNNVWLTCNVDSFYYKSDTIILFNHKYAYFEMKCAQHLEWFFASNHRLHYRDCFYQQEPPRGGALNFPPHRWKVKQQQSKTTVELKMKGKTTDRFEVISLDLQLHRGMADQPMYVLTLKRINY